MQTVSRTYGAADPEAQAAAPEQKPLGRATVAAICLVGDRRRLKPRHEPRWHDEQEEGRRQHLQL